MHTANKAPPHLQALAGSRLQWRAAASPVLHLAPASAASANSSSCLQPANAPGTPFCPYTVRRTRRGRNNPQKADEGTLNGIPREQMDGQTTTSLAQSLQEGEKKQHVHHHGSPLATAPASAGAAGAPRRASLPSSTVLGGNPGRQDLAPGQVRGSSARQAGRGPHSDHCWRFLPLHPSRCSQGPARACPHPVCLQQSDTRFCRCSEPSHTASGGQPAGSRHPCTGPGAHRSHRVSPHVLLWRSSADETCGKPSGTHHEAPPSSSVSAGTTTLDELCSRSQRGRPEPPCPGPWEVPPLRGSRAVALAA